MVKDIEYWKRIKEMRNATCNFYRRRFLVFSLAFAARFSFFMRGSTTLKRPLTPFGRRTRLLARCLRVTTYVTSSFLSCAFLYNLRK